MTPAAPAAHGAAELLPGVGVDPQHDPAPSTRAPRTKAPTNPSANRRIFPVRGPFPQAEFDTQIPAGNRVGRLLAGPPSYSGCVSAGRHICRYPVHANYRIAIHPCNCLIHEPNASSSTCRDAISDTCFHLSIWLLELIIHLRKRGRKSHVNKTLGISACRKLISVRHTPQHHATRPYTARSKGCLYDAPNLQSKFNSIILTDFFIAPNKAIIVRQIYSK